MQVSPLPTLTKRNKKQNYKYICTYECISYAPPIYQVISPHTLSHLIVTTILQDEIIPII